MTSRKKHKILKRLYYLWQDVSEFSGSFITQIRRILRARKGSKISRALRYPLEHTKIRQIFGANLALVFIVTSFIPQQTGISLAEAATINRTDTEFLTKQGTQYPTSNIKINQGYNLFHKGIDLGGYIGVDIHPFRPGKVIAAGYTTDGYGNNIVIDHGNGLTSLYAHLSKINVKIGDDITVDSIIGEMGRTGHATGPHLHFEIRQDGRQMNPFDYLPR
jgi:murein DD-endopeptidase MepM/ murein hydrolase activator NlpD